MAVFQVAFLSVSNVDKVHPLLSFLFGLKAVHGYTWTPDRDNRNVPQRVNAIGYSNNFFDNFNCMLVMQCGLVMAVVVILLVRRVARNPQKRLIVLLMGIAREYLLMLALFSSLNVGYSTGLYVLYGECSWGNTVGLIIALAILLSVIASQVCNNRHFSYEPSSSQALKEKSYFAMVLIYRVILGLTMSLLNQKEYVVVVVFSVSVLHFVYLISSNPFRRVHHNYRVVLNQLLILVVLLMRMFYRSFRMNKEIVMTSLITDPGVVEVGVLCLTVIMNAVSVGYDVYLKIVQMTSQRIKIRDTLGRM